MPGSRTSYPIPKAAASAEQTVRASRFICRVGPTSSLKEVAAELDRLASIHPKANHICWACITGPPGSPERAMSDGGEPRGTAGRPMLTVLDHSGYGGIWAAVVRYFGGIKRSFSDTVVLELQLPESFSEAFVRNMITVSSGKARCEVHE